MIKKLITLAAVVATAGVVYAGTPAKVFNEPAVQAVGNWYIAGYGGLSLLQNGMGNFSWGETRSDKKKTGWNLGLKAGYDFDPQAWVRPVVELDLMYNSFKHSCSLVDDIWSYKMNKKYKSFALMANVLAKFDLGAWQPYVGAGAGLYITEIAKSETGYESGAFDWKGNWSDYYGGFAWQILAGVDYKIDANWAVFAEYKWFNQEVRGKKEDRDWTSYASRMRLGQQLLNMGVRYSF